MKHVASAALAVLLPLACATPTELPNDGSVDTSIVAHPPVPIHHLPPPTEGLVSSGIVDEAAKMQNKLRRKAYIKERHRAAPGVDWKEIERTNGLAQQEKRNALAAMSVGVGSRWTEKGSRNQAGRMHVAAVAPDGTTLYGGSSKGGVWRGALNGVGWEPLGDNLFGGAHWLTVVSGATPSDPFIMIAATDGGSINRSTDDGATWVKPAGLPATINSVRRIFRTTDGSEIVFIVLRGWESGYKYGLWRSTDAGASFTKVRNMNNFPGDAWGPRNGAGPIFTIESSGTWRSDDNGASWSQVASLPAGVTGGELSGSEAGSPDLYAVFDVSGNGEQLWRSDDAGLSWSFGDQVNDYWGTMAASILDRNLVAYGGVETWRSYDGGTSFTKMNNWFDYYDDPVKKLHADTPGMDVWPVGINGETWFIATDGGLFRSAGFLAEVKNISTTGLGVSQYYTTLTSVVDHNHIVAGSQDQGWQRALNGNQGAGTTVNFNQLISGDYGHAVSGDGTHDYVYSVYPGFILIHIGETATTTLQEDFPPGENNAWLPPLEADPDDKEAFFFCATQLYHYKKKAGQNDWARTKWSQKNFAVSGGEYLTGVTFSPLDSNRAYAVTNFGRLYYSNDKGKTWTQSSSNGPGAHYFYGTALVASATDIDTVWVGGSGYGSPAVYRSTDGGQSFQSYNTGLPSTLVYGLAESPDDNGTLFCGTETGAYKRELGSGTWVDITQNDAPVTTYWSVEAVEALNVMRYGTYGRGIWDYDIVEACTYAPYGMALGGANTLLLDSPTPTTVGSQHQIHTSGAPPTTLGLVTVALSGGKVPVFGGFSLLGTLPVKTWLVASDANGENTRPVNIPDDNTLSGVRLYFQTLFLDPAQPDGWALSNGLVGTLCE